MTERCGDRQRKLDGLEKWPFRWLIEGLPIMLQIALLLLSCGLSRYMWSINTSVARVVIAFTVLTVVFYLVIMVAGMRSYDSPFQTPASLGLRALRHNEGVQKFLTVVSPPVVIIHTAGTNTINHIVEASRQLGRSLDRGFQNAKAKIVQGVLDLRRALLPTHADPPRRQPPPGARPRPARISVETPLEKNSNDAHCVCWVLWNITDPEAIDSAMRLAATIRWFDDGVDTDPPYDLIVSVFNSCFDSSSNLYPGMRDRAYCSGRTVLAIYVSTLVNHPERAPEFPPRNCHIPTQSFPQDPDLKSILRVFCNFSNNSPPFQDFIHPRNTSAHILWMTDLYLRYIWSQRNNLNPHHHGLLTPLKVEYEDWHTFPTTAVANLLLTRCLFLGAQVEDGILRNVDKSSVFLKKIILKILTPFLDSDDLKEISSRLSRAVINAAGHSHPHHWLLSDLLDGLAKWTSPPAYFTRYAYEWCAAICKENEDLDACKDLLVSALRLGFRRDDIYLGSPPYHPVHPDHHKRMIDVVFSTGNTDTIADALCAWTIDDTPQHRFSSLGACADHLVNLAGTKFPKRLRRMVIRAIEGIGYPEFERVGIEKFVPLLNGLNIEVCEMGQDLSLWTSHLWNVLRSSLGQEQLSSHYWQHIVPMAMQPGLNPLHVKSSDLDTMRSFEKKGDWKRLEVWIGMMWVLELPGGGIEVREVERATRTLFRERPGAFQTVEGWVLEASESDSLYTQHGNIFRMVCDEARKEEERKRSSQMPQSG